MSSTLHQLALLLGREPVSTTSLPADVAVAGMRKYINIYSFCIFFFLYFFSISLTFTFSSLLSLNVFLFSSLEFTCDIICGKHVMLLAQFIR
jgi:hypothetical protein